MSGTELYLYGLITAGEDLDFGPIGLEYQGAAARVHTLRVGTLGAVISEHAAAQRILPLRKNLEPHHRVIREVMKTVTIIPMRFGHLAGSEDDVKATLRHNREAIQAELARVDGRIEMVLKVKWDVDNIFEHIVASDPELTAFRDACFGGSYAPSQADKLELGRMFEERLNSERQRLTDSVVEGLESCASETRVSSPKSETIVMDVAFLVGRDESKAFEERIYQVAATFPSQYVFDFSGPWAPFNFVDLDLRTQAA